MSVKEFRFEAPSERQAEFFRARNRYVLYGGARGGGKSWAVRRKAELNALGLPGLQQIIIRRTFPELRENHILPMRAELGDLAVYSEKDKAFTFPNGSRIRFGYCAAESDVLQYQGQETDVLFIDEATQLTEWQFQWLDKMVRGANDHIKRTVLTANPGGVGHAFVKRLFIDRDFREAENPDDYLFIPAKVYDNPALMAKDPGYERGLKNLPPALRAAWLDGNWSVFAGQMFTEFDFGTHVIEPFDVPEHWRRYVALDYGMDMLAAYLIAIDEHDNAYVMRERYQGRDLAPGAEGLIASEAARVVADMVGEDKVNLYLAPPDLWQRKPETGRSVADIFREAAGINLTQASNDRVAGWMAVHERLKVEPDEQGQPSARLRIFRGCDNLIRTLPLLQYDEKKPNDAATEPHEITHAPDALRYFCVYWTKATRTAEEVRRTEWTKTMYEDYYRASSNDKKMLLELWGHPRGGRQI